MAHPAERRCDPEPGPPRFAGQKVLIVDDDRRGAFALGSALSARGLTVVQAASGADGVAAVENDPTICAVLMDVSMPGLDGYAATARMRELDQGAATPIIAVTFEVTAADQAKALAAGMNAHVAKPVDVPRLLRVLAELMN